MVGKLQRFASGAHELVYNHTVLAKYFAAFGLTMFP